MLEALRTYPDRATLFREYPELEEEDIRQVLAYAEALVDDRGGGCRDCCPCGVGR